MLLFGAFVHHGVEVEIVDAGVGFFDEASAAETPGGSFEYATGGSRPIGTSQKAWPEWLRSVFIRFGGPQGHGLLP